jgi:hypothetical protein
LGRGLCIRGGLEWSEGPGGDVQDGLPVGISQLVRRGEPTGKVRRNGRRGTPKGPLGVGGLFERHRVEKARGQCQEHGDLLEHRHGLGLGLLEAGTDSPPVLDDPAGGLVKAGAELREGLQFLELRVGEL